VVPKIVWFYVVSYLILACIASVALVRGIGAGWSPLAQAAAATLCIALLGGGVGFYMYAAATRKTEEHEAFRSKK
jgi:drug/metabolite transporter (DMT)-like permease